MKLSTFVRNIKELQYAEYGTDLIGKIRLIDSDTIELETVISRQNHDNVKAFCEQIKMLAGEVQYQIKAGLNKTGCEIILKAVAKKSKVNGICKQQFKVGMK